MNLGSLHKNTLIIRYPLLHNFLCLSQVGCFEFLISVEIRKSVHQSRPSGLGYPPEIFLLASPHGHGAPFDEKLKDHIVNTLCGENNIGT